jgi:hypothetical protein
MTTHESASQAPVIEHPIGDHGRVVVRTASWDIALVAGSDDVVRVRNADGGELPRGIEIQREAEGLSIRQPSVIGGISLVIGGHSHEARLAIELPASAVTNVTTASGDVRADGLRADAMLRTASGDITLTDAAGTIVAETVSGDVALTVSDSAVLTIKTVSGDVAVKGGRLERVGVTTTSGDVLLGSDLGGGPHSIATLSGDAVVRAGAGITVTARTVAGDLSSDLPHRSEGGPGRRSIVVGDGGIELQFRSVSGDLRVVGSGEAFAIPVPPTPPAPPRAPASPGRAGAGAADDAFDINGTADHEPADAAPAAESDPAVETSRLAILRALERGEIDITEATARLSELDGAER